MSEDAAKGAAQEVRLLITEGTNVIGDLQPAINGSKTTKEMVAPDALVNQFKARYQKASGNAFDPKATGIVGDARRAYVQSFTSVVTRYQGNLNKGGQDAFVPAFFRAQVLKDFNQLMSGKVQAYATNDTMRAIMLDCKRAARITLSDPWRRESRLSDFTTLRFRPVRPAESGLRQIESALHEHSN